MFTTLTILAESSVVFFYFDTILKALLHKKTLDFGNPLMMGRLLSRDGLLLMYLKYISFKSVLSKLNCLFFYLTFHSVHNISIFKSTLSQ